MSRKLHVEQITACPISYKKMPHMTTKRNIENGRKKRPARRKVVRKVLKQKANLASLLLALLPLHHHHPRDPPA
jgi:hypothetical protein